VYEASKYVSMTFHRAKEILEARGMKVNAADVASFRKVAEEKIWPAYKQQYAELWDKVANAKRPALHDHPRAGDGRSGSPGPASSRNPPGSGVPLNAGGCGG
jgi:hypothetical protein